MPKRGQTESRSRDQGAAVTPGRPLALLLLVLHLVPNFHVTGNIALRVLRLFATLTRLISRRSDTHTATTTHFYANMSYPFGDTAPHATDDIGHVPEAAGGDHDDVRYLPVLHY